MRRDPRFRLYLFGYPRLECQGEIRTFARKKSVAVLAYLASTPGGGTRDFLACLLWPTVERGSAFAGLRNSLAELRRVLGKGLLLAGRETVSVARDSRLWVDLLHFHVLVDRWRKGIPEGAAGARDYDLLGQAAELYRGEFLNGFFLHDCPEYEKWQILQAQYLQSECVLLLGQLVQHHSEKGSLAEAIHYAAHWVALDPLNDAVQRRILELYSRSEQHASALRHFEWYRRLLARDLQLMPSTAASQLDESSRRRLLQTVERMAREVPQRLMELEVSRLRSC